MAMASSAASQHGGSVTSSMSGLKRNAGVLEVKLRMRFQEDRHALAVGGGGGTGLGERNHFNTGCNPRHSKRHHVHTHIHGQGLGLPSHQDRLPPLGEPSLELGARPISFEKERQELLDTMQLPSPTRSIVERQVRIVKNERNKERSNLPPVAGAYRRRNAPHTLFPVAYQRGELPIMIESRAGGKTIRWTKSIEDLDYAKYLPLFVEGMCEKSYPFGFLAREGAFQLLQFGVSHPECVLNCLPRLIPSLRMCFETRQPNLLRDSLRILQQLSVIPDVGPRLVPYYRQILPILNMFKTRRRNLGDDMDFQQNKLQDLGELVTETLEIMEQYGGPDSYINIKYMVPTYEGVLKGQADLTLQKPGNRNLPAHPPPVPPH